MKVKAPGNICIGPSIRAERRLSPLSAKRDRKAALQFPRKAIGHHGVPEKITIDEWRQRTHNGRSTTRNMRQTSKSVRSNI